MGSASVEEAAEIVRDATALLITAGAGMGVDSGLPDFRGPEGFWRAYPPYARLGLAFEDLANPMWFRTDPALAWGFYGHRLGLYRRTRPHEGFAILRGWAGRMAHGSFVFTSNVDGQFQRAGFDPERVHECHGAIDWLQCTECAVDPFPADPFEVDVDPETGRAAGPLPVCPACGALARPAILMFGDGEWDPRRSAAQRARYLGWQEAARAAGARLAVVECGAGTDLPTVRRESETVARRLGGRLVRLNPREPAVPPGHTGLARGAADALRAIDALLHR